MNIKSFRAIEQIRAARIDRGLSCSQLALKCGVRPSLILNFECGTRPICEDTYRKICQILDL
ncbi:MAG: helix-turn-helix transcriptional regulator [Selenomonas ruminantium]|nr:helix-turn-helix transcriptional regulator [Selenomonas ruminantium]